MDVEDSSARDSCGVRFAIFSFGGPVRGTLLCRCSGMPICELMRCGPGFDGIDVADISAVDL
jgi:hypothetical protein